MHDALRTSKTPVIFSHSSVRAICDHPRNVPDEILKLLPKNGGVVMINFYSGFIARTDELKKDKQARGTLATVVDHIEHVIKTAGIDHVGIGSDFDGVNSLPVGLEDVTTYSAITQELVNRGYQREEIHKVLGGNILRVMRAAERVAKEIGQKQGESR
jgi:membrane dipeptidase